MSLPSPTIDLDTGNFVLMLRDLEKISGRDFKDVLLSQTAALLKFCITKTKAAERAGIQARALRLAKKGSTGIDHYRTKKGSERFGFPGGEVISFSGRSGHEGHVSFLDRSTFRPGKGRKQPRIIAGKSWHDMRSRRWSNERWAKYQELLAQAEGVRALTAKEVGGTDAVKRALASRGLAKHSWFQIAEAAGITQLVNVPGYVRNAKPQDGKTYQNGTAHMALEAVAAYIEVSNDYPNVVRMNGQALLNYAISARVKAFERDVENGVFRDLKVRAERYPGIFVSQS